jgi:cytochrome bd-type quinol oxidase subunit 2
MNPRWRYLAASALDFAKPFLVSAVALRIGLAKDGAVSEAFLRVLLFPHLATAVCFLLLFADRERYRPFIALAALIHSGSLAALVLGAFPAVQNPQALSVASGGAQEAAKTVALYFSIALVDLTCLAILISGRTKTRTEKEQ